MGISILAVLALLVSFDSSPPVTTLAEIVDSVPGFRPTMGRLTAGFDHASCHFEAGSELLIPTPTCSELQPGQLGHFEDLSRSLLARQNSPSTVEQWHVVGLWNLSFPRPGSIDRAVGALEVAVELSPNKAKFWNDLAVAYLARAQLKQHPGDLIRSLTSIEKASRLTASRPEARREILFNRGLVSSYLMRYQACEAWRRYLREDSQSAWAAEGRQHRQRLDCEKEGAPMELAVEVVAVLDQGRPEAMSKLVARRSNAVRDHLVGRLTRWAKFHRAGDSEQANQALDEARTLAAALREVTGDALFIDAVRAIDRAIRRGDNLTRDALVAGHLAYDQGLEHVQSGDSEAALVAFQAAEVALTRSRTPFVHWAEYRLFLQAFRTEDHADVLLRVWRLHDQLNSRGYASFVGLLTRLRGTLEHTTGRTTETLRSYEAALDLFRTTSEVDQQGAMHLRLGGLLADLGRIEDAWLHHYKALRILRTAENSVQYQLALVLAVFSALNSGETETALLLQEESLALARKRDDPVLLTGVLRHKATLLARIGDDRGAAAALEEASQQSRRIGDESQRANSESHVFFEAGRLWRTREPGRSLPLFEQAINSYRRRGFGVLLPHIMQEKALAFRALGQIPQAEAVFRDAIEQLEEQRGHQWTIEDRISFADRFESIYRDMISLQLRELKNEIVAFDYLERLRSRVLLDKIEQAPGARERNFAVFEPRPAAEILASLPPQTVFVSFHATSEELFSWMIRDGSVTLARSAVSLERLQRLAEQTRTLDLEQGRDLDPVLIELHDHLILPIENQLEPGDRLVLAPEAFLYSIPFAALTSRRSGRFLVEDHPLSVVPSLNIYHGLSKGKPTLSVSPAVLVVADPAFDRTLFPDLERLAGSQQERDIIRELFPRTQVLEQEQATREAFLSCLGRHEIIHIGAHAINDSHSAFRARLVLAPSADGRDSGILYSWELLDLPAQKTRLVVLAACESAAAGPIRSEGFAGLAWPVLASGVPVVIATTRNIEDRATSRFLASFYRFLYTERDPEIALHRAQLQALQQGRKQNSIALDWAAFQMYGVPGPI